MRERDLEDSETGERVKVRQYLERLEADGYVKPKMQLLDLDEDGSEELVLEYYTGGAHCCSAVEIYSLSADGVYELRGELPDGLIDEQDEAALKLTDIIGYFYSCYACEVEIPHPEITLTVSLRFRDKKLVPAPVDPHLNALLRENMEALSELGLSALDEVGMDAGERKAVARCLVVYHFNNRCAINATHEFFLDYFGEAPERDELWSQISSQIAEIAENWVKPS